MKRYYKNHQLQIQNNFIEKRHGRFAMAVTLNLRVNAPFPLSPLHKESYFHFPLVLIVHSLEYFRFGNFQITVLNKGCVVGS